MPRDRDRHHSFARRVVPCVLAGLLALAGCGGPGASDAGRQAGDSASITIGYNADFNGASIAAIATKKNLWKKYGVDAEIKEFTNGPIQIQAMAAGDLDIGYIGPGATWLPASGRNTIVAINSLGFADCVIAQPGRGIENIADLKGKTVGVPEGTSGDMILRLALQKHGLSVDDINMVVMEPSTIVSAMSSSRIDAAGIWYPLISDIKKRVPGLKSLVCDKAFYPEHVFPSSFVVRDEFMQQQPETVEKTLRAMQEANDFRAKNLDQAIKITAEYIDAPVKQMRKESTFAKYLTTDKYVTAIENGQLDEWYRTIEQLFVDIGTLDKVHDPDTFIATKLYLKAARSGS